MGDADGGTRDNTHPGAVGAIGSHRLGAVHAHHSVGDSQLLSRRPGIDHQRTMHLTRNHQGTGYSDLFAPSAAHISLTLIAIRSDTARHDHATR